MFCILQISMKCTFFKFCPLYTDSGSEWGSDNEQHRDIKDMLERVGQQLRGGSAASIGPGGLASNQSGFDVY